MTITLSSIVSLSREQASADVSDEVVVVNLASGRYYGLNPVGARIWDLLRTARRVHEIRDAIVEDYDVDPTVCASDVVALLEHLAEEGLVEVKG